jgi:hypothetical protein
MRALTPTEPRGDNRRRPATRVAALSGMMLACALFEPFARAEEAGAAEPPAELVRRALLHARLASDEEVSGRARR